LVVVTGQRSLFDPRQPDPLTVRQVFD
jgi:hypothetical protein